MTPAVEIDGSGRVEVRFRGNGYRTAKGWMCRRRAHRVCVARGGIPESDGPDQSRGHYTLPGSTWGPTATATITDIYRNCM